MPNKTDFPTLLAEKRRARGLTVNGLARLYKSQAKEDNRRIKAIEMWLYRIEKGGVGKRGIPDTERRVLAKCLGQVEQLFLEAPYHQHDQRKTLVLHDSLVSIVSAQEALGVFERRGLSKVALSDLYDLAMTLERVAQGDIAD